jgi:hypothetical protein
MTGESTEGKAAPALLRTFNSRHEADFIASVLSSEGIRAVVFSDDCGAVDPALGFVRGVEVYVAEEDLERARQILEDATAGETAGSGGGEDEAP